MSIEKIISLIEKVNIAEDMPDVEGENKELRTIGKDVLEGFDADWDSMEEWRDCITEGLDLIAPATEGKSEPWEGASNFKTPILMEARLKFGDRASEELLGTDDLIKGKTFGDDPEGSKKDRVKRVGAFMNFQLTVEDDEWVDQQDKLLYNLSQQGQIYKKVFFDPTEGHNVSEVVMFPNFAINQSAKSTNSAPRFTHRIFKSPNQIETLTRAKVWRDVDVMLGAVTSEEEDADGNKKVETTKDKTTEFYEQQCRLDLDDDGYAEPYIVTVHATTGKVMRIVAQMSIDDIYIMNDEGKVITVDKIVKRDENGDAVIIGDEVQFTEDEGDWEIIKINRNVNITPYEFLTNPRGQLLSVGYFHVLGSYAQAINATTNRLQDAGTLANMQGGYIARGFRKRMGNMKVKPGSYNQTNLSAQELATGIRDYNFKEPSATLHALLKDMIMDAQRLGATVDLGSVIGPNTPAATVLSIVHEQQGSVGAIILRVWRAMTKEFRILYRLNSQFIDPELYAALLDDEDADPMADFNTQDMDVVPTANPKNNSTIQRIHKSEAEKSLIPDIVAVGGNPKPIIIGALEAIGSDKIDEVFPTLSPEAQKEADDEKKRIEALEEQMRFLPIKAQADAGEGAKQEGQATVMNAETKQYEAQQKTGLDRVKGANIQMDTNLKAANVKKVMSETEGKNLEIDIANSGVMDLLEDEEGA